ncbi:DUF4236 domain-containing protein [Novosphingobium rosa]|uniref:DUF4236 domain-containing protein n=1 Tax=Novosphingobium rosa TaxID=76978 RepID=UPI000A041069|nr:DUF4236 domain-containing protein [Novosphingobium rosa]
MPLYFRKSVSAGPFRFNFSSGGVGASVGMKGLRLGTGPRGHYVHAGRGGFYYRATIDKAGKRQTLISDRPRQPLVPAVTYESGVDMIEVESGDVLAMRDGSLSDLLDDINAKRDQLSMAAVLGGTLAGLALLWAFAGGPNPLVFLPLIAVGWAAGRWLDSYRRTCVLFYDLEAEVEKAYEVVVRHFDGLMGCAGKWHIEAGGAVQDLTTWKRNAGASHIVKRKPTDIGYKLPRSVKSNITPPALHVGKQILFFLPDGILVDDGRHVGAVSYTQLTVTCQNSNFIEEGSVPRDAEVSHYTWKHPNKNGGPDRRFRDNRQIPVCRYEAMHLRSGSGLNELVEFSKRGVAKPFSDALHTLPRKAIQAPALANLS